MNVLEAAELIDQAIALRAWSHPGDDELLAGQAEAWAEALSEVPLDFALRMVRSHTGVYEIRPSQIRGGWEESRKAERMNRSGDERACAFDRWCHCTHSEGECYRGFRDTPVDKDREVVQLRKVGGADVAYPQGVWCPNCWTARNYRRSEMDKEPLPIGVIGPGR